MALEIYMLLLFDRISGTFLLPLNWPYMVEAMLYMGGMTLFEKVAAILISIIGSCIGATGDWYIGKTCLYIRKDGSSSIFTSEKPRIIVLKLLFTAIILFGYKTPIGGLFALLSGFCSMRLSYTTFAIAISNSMYLIYIIYNTAKL